MEATGGSGGKAAGTAVASNGTAGPAHSPISRRDLLDIVRKHSDSLPRPVGYGDPAAAAAGRTPSAPPSPAPVGPGKAAHPPAPGTPGAGPLAGMLEESSPALMDGRYWKQMLDMYFIAGGAAAGVGGSEAKEGAEKGEGDGERVRRHEALFDDMLFFVRQEKSALGQILNFFGSLMSDSSGNESVESEEKAKPYFVRRWSPLLEKVVGESAEAIDWRRSYYLNLICHTEYSLTVAICTRQALEAHRRSSRNPVPPLYKVTKRVYASPSKARIDVDTSKAHETLPSYPDICFAVDDYDNTFDAVVLENPDHCFCVLLNAHGGAAFPPEDMVEKTTADGKRRVLLRGTSSEAKALGVAQDGTPMITLFSGFVSYPMVRAAFQGGMSTGFTLWGTGTQPPSKAEKLVMRGPGGRGEAEVAVTGVTPPESATAAKGESSASTLPSSGGGISDRDDSGATSSPSAAAAASAPAGGRKGEQKRASLEDLQAKLFAVQEELMRVVQALQGGDGAVAAEGEETEVEKKRRDEENQKRLVALQAELKAVQAQLQKGQGKGGAGSKGGGSGGGGGGGGSGGGIAGFLKKVTAAPPRRTMVHEEGSDEFVDAQSSFSPSGPGPTGSTGSPGRGKKGPAGGPPAVLPLRCCLMSLSLPWDLLAFDLLFKEMPIKVDIGGRIFPPRRPTAQDAAAAAAAAESDS